jgi:hypothetical protein
MRRPTSAVGARGAVVEADPEVGVAAALPPLPQEVEGDPSGLTTTSAEISPEVARIVAAARLTRRRSVILPRRRWVKFTSIASAL